MRTIKILVLALAAGLATFLVLPQPAAACGGYCIYPDGCGTCVSAGEWTGAFCYQMGECACIEMVCSITPEEQEQAMLLDELGLDAAPRAACPASAPSAPASQV